MAKLYFKYGTMNASKSMDLLRTAYNYEKANTEVICVIPELETRSKGKIISRALKEKRDATIITKDNKILNTETNFYTYINHKKSILNNIVVLCDESQFFNKDNIIMLRKIVDEMNIPIICWGLKNNFKKELFEGSYNLLIHADVIEEIIAICFKCGTKKTLYNVLLKNGEIQTEGNEIQIGDTEYISICSPCYNKMLKK